MSPTRLPLEEIVVLDLSNLLPGPYATMLLSDFGADVIKVERPGTGDPGRTTEPTLDGVSTRHDHLNRNKRSIALDLKDPEDRETFLVLLRGADVLVEGFRPGTMRRLGLAYDDLAAVNPALVYCSVNGFGSASSADAPAHDLNFMGLAGLLPAHLDDGGLDPPPTQIADLAGGALPAVIGILLALYARRTTGRGQHVDISMMHGSLGLQVEALAYLNAGRSSSPGSTRLTGRYPCYRLYPTLDSRQVAVGATEPHFWRNLVHLLDLPHLVDSQYAVGDAAVEVIEQLTARFSARPLAEWEQLLHGADTCTTPVRTFEEAVEAESACGQPPVTVGRSDGTDVRHLAPSIVLSGTPARTGGRAPDLDEHRADVLRHGTGCPVRPRPEPSKEIT